MTCIVGIVASDGVLIAGDLQSTRSGWGDIYVNRQGKVHTPTDVVAIGVCGSVRESQVLRYHVTVPKLAMGIDELEWVVTEFVPVLRKALRDHGCMDSKPEKIEGEILLGVRGRLFHMFHDMQVGENADRYTAAGSGENVARGSLAGAALTVEGGERKTTKDLIPIAREALRVSHDFNAYVGDGVTHVATKLFTDAERKWAEKVVAA